MLVSHTIDDNTQTNQTMPKIAAATNNQTHKPTNYTHRKPLTPERKAELEALNKRTLFVKGEGRSLTRMFLSRPRTLKMEIFNTCKTDVEAITIIRGTLRVTCQNRQTKKMMIKDSLTHIGGKPVEISEPHALARHITTNENKPEPVYDVKVVIHGLLESDEIRNEIASDIGAKYMRRLVRRS